MEVIQVVQTIDNSQGVEICWGTRIDAENLLCVPDHSGKITWQNHLGNHKNIYPMKSWWDRCYAEMETVYIMQTCRTTTIVVISASGERMTTCMRV